MSVPNTLHYHYHALALICPLLSVLATDKVVRLVYQVYSKLCLFCGSIRALIAQNTYHKTYLDFNVLLQYTPTCVLCVSPISVKHFCATVLPVRLTSLLFIYAYSITYLCCFVKVLVYQFKTQKGYPNLAVAEPREKRSQTPRIRTVSC